MTPARAHANLLFTATSFWTFFYLAGLPSGYFQSVHWGVILVVGEILPAVALLLVGPAMLRSLRTTPWRAAAWASFWWTGPLLLYDFVVLRLHGGEDWSYLWRYWYLTGFTLVPWAVFAALAFRSSRETPTRP